ncbi:hypothetical protein NOR_02818 [Metarhizium rileyi]|uniref:Uncharacterized protein n=1 Tax=Metarhizium rileyi (strain RCEF 4871) TaxID=1649241 RepID=A0A167G2E3_METRR|nr:hypothetical protein NOR_02818 [Metarhizium rileyi RCEF 4871]
MDYRSPPSRIIEGASDEAIGGMSKSKCVPFAVAALESRRNRNQGLANQKGDLFTKSSLDGHVELEAAQ